MKRFKWRLQSVLDVKEKQERLKRAELFELTRKLDQMNDELSCQKRILSDLLSDLSKEVPKSRLEKQVFFMTHVKANDEVIRKMQSSIKELQLQREQKMIEVMEFKKLTQGLNQLRDKAERQFVAEQEKLEQKISDEMTTCRFALERINQVKIEEINV